MEGEKFPIRLKILVVDDNLPCLKILERQLIKCKYEVTTTTDATIALEMLRANKDKFDIVLSDVHMPGMDGFKLLELIGLELDIPVIMLSGSDNPELVMKGVRHGAVDYLVKPARIEELKNIWQHVIRKNQCKQKGKANPDSESDARDDGDNNANLDETRSRKRKEQNTTEDECQGEDEDSNIQKKPRFVWSPKRHMKFVVAIDQLGLDKASPKKIIKLMNVEGLTRWQVASHLQKYRTYLKRLNSSSNQSTASFNFNFYNPGLSQGSTGHFQHQNNNSTKVDFPSLEDYTRCMENWKNTSSVNLPTAQQNMLSSNGISYPQNAPERTFLDVSSAPFGFQNVSCNTSVQCNGFFDSPAGQMSGTSGFVQNAVQDDEVDGLMATDDSSYLLEDPVLVDGFTQNNGGGTLEDLLRGILK